MTVAIFDFCMATQFSIGALRLDVATCQKGSWQLIYSSSYCAHDIHVILRPSVRAQAATINPSIVKQLPNLSCESNCRGNPCRKEKLKALRAVSF